MKKEKLNIRCYDDGGKSVDRYTVVYMDQPESGYKHYACVGMSANPFHPQGVGQHSIATVGRHLGKRIQFEDLPEDCRELVRRDLA